PSPTPPAPTQQGTASPSHYHRPPATPSPSPHQAQPPGSIMTSNNTPPAGPPRLLKLLALRLSRRFYSPPSSCASYMSLACAYVFRDAVPGPWERLRCPSRLLGRCSRASSRRF